MKIQLDLTTDVSIALRRFAADDGLSREDATIAALRDWLVANGYLELEHDLAEDAAAPVERLISEGNLGHTVQIDPVLFDVFVQIVEADGTGKSVNEAVNIALTSWGLAQGFLKSLEFGEDSETAGIA